MPVLLQERCLLGSFLCAQCEANGALLVLSGWIIDGLNGTPGDSTCAEEVATIHLSCSLHLLLGFATEHACASLQHTERQASYESILRVYGGITWWRNFAPECWAHCCANWCSAQHHALGSHCLPWMVWPDPIVESQWCSISAALTLMQHMPVTAGCSCNCEVRFANFLWQLQGGLWCASEMADAGCLPATSGCYLHARFSRMPILHMLAARSSMTLLSAP